MLAVGVDGHPTRTRVLSLLSVAGVLGSVVLGWLVLARTGQPSWFWGYLFVLLSGPTLAYARALPARCSRWVCWSRSSPRPCSALAVVVGLAAFGAQCDEGDGVPVRRRARPPGSSLAETTYREAIGRHVAWGAGRRGALRFVATSLFNVVRFGSVLNTNYLDEPELHTPGFARTLEYAAAVTRLTERRRPRVLACSHCRPARGGMRAPVRAQSDLDRRRHLVLASAVVLLTVGFARWWTPFGWSAYGPRLMLPWLLPARLARARRLRRRARRLAQRRPRAARSALWPVFVAVLLLTIPHLGNLMRARPDGRVLRYEESALCGPASRRVESRRGTTASTT